MKVFQWTRVIPRQGQRQDPHRSCLTAEPYLARLDEMFLTVSLKSRCPAGQLGDVGWHSTSLRLNSLHFS